MNPRQWTTLVVRGIGVWLAGQACITAVPVLTILVLALLDPWFRRDSFQISDLFAGALHPLSSGVRFEWMNLVILAGYAIPAWYLLLKGQWLIDRVSRELEPGSGSTVGHGARTVPEARTDPVPAPTTSWSGELSSHERHPDAGPTDDERSSDDQSDDDRPDDNGPTVVKGF